MNEAQFGEALDEFAVQLEELANNLREAERFDVFQEMVASALHKEIKSYRRVLNKPEAEIPLEGWSGLEWREAYVYLAKTMSTGYSHEMGEVRGRAEAVAKAEMARWLEGLERTGKSNLMGIHIPWKVS